MEITPVSPPKSQRVYLQEINLGDCNHYLQRNPNSVKKKLEIEQENYDSSNFSSAKKFSPFPKKAFIQCSLASKFSAAKANRTEFMSLPSEVHLEILKYLSPEDIIKKIQLINRYWYKVSNDKRLWEALDKFQKLCVDLKYIKQQCIVERRSKGKLFKAISRLNRQPSILRRIHLALANAGFNDGLPTSVLREISYLSNLDHINITKIKEVEINKDFIQICSDYHDYNLKEYMKLHLFKIENKKAKLTPPHAMNLSVSEYRTLLTEYRMPLRNIKLITYQLLKGLCHLHHQGIIHRNLKSDNIFINTNGDVKISDFGLSRLVNIPHVPYTPEDPKDRERSGREARRLWYRAPELLLRKSLYSFEVDIWAFGCLLAELVMNEPLFNGDSEIEQLFKIFRFIGSPNANNWANVSDNADFKISFPNWESVYFPYVCYPEDTEEFHHIYNVMVPNRESAFKRLATLGTSLGTEGLDLLWNCLMLNPQMRPHASTLLTHKFFDEIRNEAELKYIGVTCCESHLCENSGLYTIPNMLDCHLISYFGALKKNEADFKPDPNYLAQQPIITEHMRSILIDWLIDVSVHFDVMTETLHYCINSIDRVLSKMKIDKSKLQLVGVTCMKIADVCHEKSKEYYKQENANEFAYITADEYTASELIEMEKIILNLLGFKLNAPNAIHFLKVYVTLLQIPEQITIIALFLVDLMLMSYQIMEFDYSLVASAALFLACKCAEYKIDETRLKSYREYLDVYTQREFEKCVTSFKCIWNTMQTSPNYLNFDAVYHKYQNQFNFFGKTLLPPVFYQNDIEEWFYTKF